MKFLNDKFNSLKGSGLNSLMSVFNNASSRFDSFTKSKSNGGLGSTLNMQLKILIVLLPLMFLLSLFEMLIPILPYLIGVVVLLIFILRKQLQRFVSKKYVMKVASEGVTQLKSKVNQELGDNEDRYAKGVVVSAGLEEIPKNDRRKVKGPRKGLKITYTEQTEEIVATILIQKGKLKVGDGLQAHYSIFGYHDCLVSRIYNENGKKVEFAEAGQTVSITGFFKLFSSGHIDITNKPIDGKKFEAYNFQANNGADEEFSIDF